MKKLKYRPRLAELPTTEAQKELFQNFATKVREMGIEKALQLLDPSQYSQNKHIVKEESKSNLSFNLDGTNIQTVEQLIKACNIDTDIWQIDKFRTSTWMQKEGGEQLYSVRATFKRSENDITSQFLTHLKQNLYDYKAPNKVSKTKIEAKDYIGIINIYDAHIDKMTVISETGKESDIYKNVALFENHFDELLNYIGVPEFIIFPIGNDFFNVNDSRNTTKKGTPQPTYMSFIDAYKIGLNLIRRCIDKARHLAPVYIPCIQGNHDEDLISILSASLSVIYADCEDVTIDDSRLQRKYFKYYSNLFMFDHGDKVKVDRVPLMMAEEKPIEYAKTTNRIAFRGHCHHRQEYNITTVKETVGVTVKHLRALSQPSNWNVQAGWIGAQKSTTAYKISRDGKRNDSLILTL